MTRIGIVVALVACAGCGLRTTERYVVVVDGTTMVCTRNVNTFSNNTSDERCVQVQP